MLDYILHSASEHSLAGCCLCWVNYTLKLQVSKVTVTKSGAFDLTVEKVCLQSIRWKHGRALHRFDGYIAVDS